MISVMVASAQTARDILRLVYSADVHIDQLTGIKIYDLWASQS